MFFLPKHFRIIITTGFMLFSCSVIAQTKAEIDAHKHFWNTPSSADTLINPYSHQLAAKDSGKVLYMKICAVCHGNAGKGDGIAAAGLPQQPADHTSAIVQSQTDGALYYELSNGHSPMPGYKSTLTEKQRWELICYIRSLNKTTKK